MFGQGRPNFHRCHCRHAVRGDRFPCALKFALILISSLLFASGNLIAQDSLQLNAAGENLPGDLKLRFAWGGGTAQKWRGKIVIRNGSFVDSRVLAINSDAPSTVVRREKELTIHHRIASSYGGVDASIKIEGDVSVQVEIKAPQQPTFVRTWTLQQLGEGINEPIDQQENRLSVSRSPGDKIRVRVNRPHLVFEPGETWKFETQLQRCGFANQDIASSFQWKSSNTDLPTLSAAPERFTTDENGSSNAQSVELNVPDQEGTYDLWIELTPPAPRTTFSQFRKPKKLSRRVQIVVVSPQAPDVEDAVAWRTSQSFTAQQLRGSFRASWPVPRLPGSREPVRKGDLSLVEVGQADSALELGPGASLTIPVERPAADARPVRVSLRYRRIPGTRLAVNYLSASEQVLHGMDSGIIVGDQSDGDPQWLTHRFCLWPEDEPGYLHISNSDSQTRARIGELKIESGPARLVAAAETDEKPAGRRERMAFLESPDFAGLFQAQRVIDPQSGQALDDWNTFHDAIDRLTQHLRANLYDGALVTVASDGSAIFPSFGLAPGPRFDSGVFSSSGCDPIQKDVVELMMRMFSREGLKLVPVLTLNSTLGQLEAMRNSERMSFDLVDFEGQTVDFDQSSLPVYNPLDDSLQDACLQSVRRFAGRYQDHRAFAGLALVCRPDCCTLLPGPGHGFDRATLQKFLQTQGLDSSNFDSNTLLDPQNPLHPQWLSWRSAMITQWHAEMAHSIGGTSHRPLYLMPIDIYQKKEFVTAMSPSLHRSGDFERAMKEIGLDPPSGKSGNGVIVLAPRRIAPGFSLAQRRIDLNIEQSLVPEQFFAAHSGGVLFTHRGKWQRIAAGVSDSLDATRKQLFLPAGNDNARRYIDAIRKFDCRLFVDGGKSLPLGGEQSVEKIVRILRELPDKRFRDIGDASSGPVCMRQLSVEGKHYFYAVNDSPWPVEVTAWLENRKSPQLLQASSVSGRKNLPLATFDGKEVLLEQQQGRNRIRIFLEPWSIYAAGATTWSAFNPYAIERFEVSLPADVESGIRKRLYQLKSKLAEAKAAQPVSQLQNGGFESFADPEQSGWELGNHDEARFELDTSDYREGRMSLSMHTTGKPVWIRSNILELPETGRLSVSAWLRTLDADSDPQPRLSVEGKSAGASIYRFGTVGDGPTGALDSDWRRFVVHFDDLPGDTTDLRIGFDLMAPGQVSIDQVEVLDRWFDENDSVAMTQLLASAGSQLQDAQSIDGSRRVLESYWVQFLDQYIGNQPAVSPQKVEERPFEIPVPTFEMPKFELPGLAPKKPRRVPLFQRFQRRE